jgi:polysaccharide transporter, PST family
MALKPTEPIANTASGEAAAEVTTRHGIPLGVMHNLFAMYGQYCASYLLALVTVPYLGRVLGPATWGLLAAVQSFGGYLLLSVEFGFALSATKEAAKWKHDPAMLRQILAGVLGAKMILALAAAGLAAIAERFFTVFHGHFLLFWSGVFWALVQGSNMIWFFQGLERMRVVVLLDMAVKTAAVVATFGFVRGPADDWKVLGLQGAASLLSLMFSLSLAWREVGFAFPRPGLVIEALRRSLATFIPRNASVLSSVGNAFLLSLFAPPHIVGYYAGADRICRAVVGLLAPASEAVYPRITQLAQKSTTDSRRLAQVAGLGVGIVGLLLGALMFALAPLLVRTLLGPDFEPAIPVLRIFSILAPAFAVRNVLSIHWMLPLDLERPLNAIVLAAGAVNVLLTVMVAPSMGEIGVAWVVVGSQVVASLGTYLVLRWMGLNPLSANAEPREQQTRELYLVGRASE